MNIADRFQIDENISGQNQEEWKSFTSDKNVSYVVDQQNGSYSNQVSFDLTSIVASNSWMSLRESYALLPFNTTLTSSAALTNAVTSNTVNLKNNFINYVDSIQFFVNGEQMIDQTTYSNMPINVMDMLTMSQDDLKVKGTAIGIQPDTTTSIRYPGANATTAGDGYVNNVYLPNAAATTLTSQDYSTMNTGLQTRNLNTFLTPAAIGTTATSLPPTFCTSGTGASNAYTQILQPYFSNDGTNKKVGSWNYVVYLPLGRLSDVLHKYPLIKGSQIRIVINFNASSVPITLTGSTTMSLSNPTMTAGNTVTPMVTSMLVNGLATSTTSTLTLTTKIQTTTVAAVANTTAQSGFAALPNCRIYVPTYKVNPTYEERLLSNRVQRIRYIDWYQQPILKVSNSAGFQTVLTTALTNVKALIILPFQNGSSGLFASATCSDFQSPFSSAPSTTLPGGMLAFQNFNVSVSGINIFNQNQNYNFDNWSQEVQRLSLNAGLSKEISSGLVDLQTWNWSPYVICDLSRRTESADGTYQSVTVSGTNNSGVTVDYYAFIAFEKEYEIDTLTGAVRKIF